MKEAEAAKLKRMREWLRRYRRSARGKAATRRSDEKYRESKKGKAVAARYRASAQGKTVRARYLASPRGKEAKRRDNEKYRKSKKGKAAYARYLASPKGKAFKRAANRRYTESRRKNAMRRQYAKKLWRALADRYDEGTLAQIQRAIQRRLTRAGPNRPGLRAQLMRDEKRCRRAIDAIGPEYPKKLKPARQPARLGVSRKKR